MGQSPMNSYELYFFLQALGAAYYIPDIYGLWLRKQLEVSGMHVQDFMGYENLGKKTIPNIPMEYRHVSKGSLFKPYQHGDFVALTNFREPIVTMSVQSHL